MRSVRNKIDRSNLYGTQCLLEFRVISIEFPILFAHVAKSISYANALWCVQINQRKHRKPQQQHQHQQLPKRKEANANKFYSYALNTRVG